MTRRWLALSITTLCFSAAACGGYDDKGYNNTAYDEANTAYDASEGNGYGADANATYAPPPDGNVAYAPPPEGNVSTNNMADEVPPPPTTTNSY